MSYLSAYIRGFASELEKIAGYDPEYVQFMGQDHPPPLPPQLLVQILETPKYDFMNWWSRRWRGSMHTPAGM